MTRGVVAALVVWSAAFPAADPGLVSRDVYLMGTRAVLTTHGGTRDEGLARLESALAVLEDADRELSTWRADSPMSALNQQPVGAPWQMTSRLCRLFADLDDWQTVTDRAFDPMIGRLTDAWAIHDGGRLPTAADLLTARSTSGLDLLSIDRRQCTLTRRAEATIDVGAFGKGEALDRVEAALGDWPWMIDLGGQVSAHGDGPDGAAWPVTIAHPWRRDQPFLRIRMREGSLSTSGGSERDLTVNGVRVGHILDPRTGQPAPFHGSVTVWHRRALAADVLSTALYVMGPRDGLRWAEARGFSVCYLMAGRGGAVHVAATPAFRRLILPDARPAGTPD